MRSACLVGGPSECHVSIFYTLRIYNTKNFVACLSCIKQYTAWGLACVATRVDGGAGARPPGPSVDGVNLNGRRRLSLRPSLARWRCRACPCVEYIT